MQIHLKSDSDFTFFLAAKSGKNIFKFMHNLAICLQEPRFEIKKKLFLFEHNVLNQF